MIRTDCLSRQPLPHDVITIKHKELRDPVKIAEGGFGIIYRAEHINYGTVAYKELRTNVIGTETRSVLLGCP